jgi:CheY-like chemotaxis protein
MVFGDEKRLVQVVANLLNNAAKYTPPGGHIEVATEVRDGFLRLAVKDNGIGMEPATAAHVFELFSQAKRSPDRAGGGLGLGLALVKSLVELHGGQVCCASEGLGKGSTFAVSLPLAGAEAEHERLPGEVDPAAMGDRKPLRVVVVDDNTDAAEMLAMLLEGVGYGVTTHGSAKAALAHAQEEAADVYLLDIGLPEISGHELARRLKAQSNKSDAVFIAITGYGQESDRAEAIRAGFSHHLVKPVDPVALLSLLNETAAIR